jgi:O-antigen/teichoic acid export membrane protein
VVVLSSKLAVLLTTVAAVRVFDKAEAGQLFVGLAIGAIGGALLSLGLPEAVSRLLGHHLDGSPDLTSDLLIGSLGLWLVGAVSTLGVVAAGCVVSGQDGAFTALLLLSGLFGALNAIQLVLATFLRIRGQVLAGELCVSAGSLIFLPVLVVGASAGISSAAGALALRGIIEIAIAAAGGIALLVHHRSGHPLAVRRNMASLVGAASPLWLTSTSWFVIQNIGTLLLAVFAGPVSVAYYQPVFKVADTAGGIASMFGPYILPVAARLRVSEGFRAVNRLYVDASRIAFGLSVPLLAILAFDTSGLTSFLFGFENSELTTVAALLCIAYGINGAVGFNGIILESFAPLRLLAMRSLAVLFIVLVANTILIATNGMLGAAWGTLAGYVAINLLNSTLLFKEAQITPWQRRLLIPVGGVLAAAFFSAGLVQLSAFPVSVAAPVLCTVAVIGCNWNDLEDAMSTLLSRVASPLPWKWVGRFR